MNEEDLRIFGTVVSELSISSAARRLGRVPSNVTVRIQGMERELNTTLFLREKNRLTLSPEGRNFLRYANEILRLHEEARMSLRPGEPVGELILGAMDSVAATRLPFILSEFHRRYPRASVHLTTGTTGGLLARLNSGDIEAALVADVPSSQDLAACVVSDEKLVLIAPAGHRRIRVPKDLRFHTCFAFSRGCAYRARLERWLQEGEVVPARVSELSSYHAMLGCVAAGMGVALIPQILLDQFSAPSSISIHALPRVIAEVEVSLVWKKKISSGRVSGLEAVVREWRKRNPVLVDAGSSPGKKQRSLAPR